MLVARSTLFGHNIKRTPFVVRRRQQQVLQVSAMSTERKLPAPPFSLEDAVKKVRMAEDAWNTRNPDKVRHPGRVSTFPL